MQSHDTNGREYLKLSEAKTGMIVELDDGFTCREHGEAVIEIDREGSYFRCADGKHYLEGQCDDESDYCIGVYKCN